jgi:hypothetical protein
MSTRTITRTYCDVCGKDDDEVEIVKTTTAQVGWGGKVIMREASEDDARQAVREGRKRRDYCEPCVDGDWFYCERCKAPHQSECPVEVAEIEARTEAVIASMVCGK